MTDYIYDAGGNWHQTLELRALPQATIRRKLSALSSLFGYLCERNAATHNPVKPLAQHPTFRVK